MGPPDELNENGSIKNDILIKDIAEQANIKLTEKQIKELIKELETI